MIRRLIAAALIGMVVLSGCTEPGDSQDEYPDVRREDTLPADIVKRGPDADHHPPILHSPDFLEPVPLPHPINTAGAEDSPFVLPDGNTLYFFFTPDARVIPEEQLFDNVTGVWVSHRQGGIWNTPERVWLQEPGRLAIDGAVCVQEDEMWFASAREGFTGVNMFTARLVNQIWTNWRYAGDRLMKEIQIGEVHLHGNDLYFHSARIGGSGDTDIWVTTRNGDTWSDPMNIHVVNTTEWEKFPFISSDGEELWFSRGYQGTPAIYRSRSVGGSWGTPELILSQFAAEPTLDNAGNLYFVHHFVEHDVLIEADIYVAYRK